MRRSSPGPTEALAGAGDTTRVIAVAANAMSPATTRDTRRPDRGAATLPFMVGIPSLRCRALGDMCAHCAGGAGIPLGSSTQIARDLRHPVMSVLKTHSSLVDSGHGETVWRVRKG